MVLPLMRLHDVRGERKALMAARPFVPEAGRIPEDIRSLCHRKLN